MFVKLKCQKCKNEFIHDVPHYKYHTMKKFCDICLTESIRERSRNVWRRKRKEEQGRKDGKV
uniref:Uncharacterized protein n=1 Tax=viral metagenome TaxID=1070528 RepID=A0A6M3IRY6_9ZZZZ